MKKIILPIVAVMLFACNSSNKADDENTTEALPPLPVPPLTPAPVVAVKPPSADSLQMLKNLNGKYPREAKLFDLPAVQQRLQKLLGQEQYQYLLRTWAVEIPTVVKDDMFMASGCEANNCGATNFMIVYHFPTNTLSAGIRRQGKVELYKEAAAIPAALSHWANEKQ